MKNNFHLSTLAKCVIRASATAVAAGSLLSPWYAFATPLPHGMIDGANAHHHFWLIDKASSTGNLKKGDANQNVYFSHNHRTEKDTQTLVVKGTDLSGHYINASDNGTANVIMTDKADADFIEAGNPRSTTNTHILVINSTLNGPKENFNYDDKAPGSSVMDKNYLQGAAIYLDRMDKGDLSVGLLNHTTVTGDIFASQDGRKDILIDNSAVKKGSIIFNGPSSNTITVTHGSLDAQGGKGADNDYAISTSNAKQNTLDISHNSTLNGGIHLTGAEHADFVNIADSTVKKLTTPGARAIDISGSRQLQLNVARSHVIGDAQITQAEQAHVSFTDTRVDGDMVLDAGKNSTLNLQHSKVNGTLKMSGNAPQSITISQSSFNGIDAHDAAGDMTLSLNDHSAVSGNVSMAKGNNTLVLGQGSSVAGDLKGGSGKNSILMEENSSIVGKTSDFSSITTSGDNVVFTPDIIRQTVILNNNSWLGTGTLEDAKIDTDTLSTFNVGSAKGHNSITVSRVASDTRAGTYNLGHIAEDKTGSIKVAFANNQRTSSARLGAYNVDLSLQDEKPLQTAKTPVSAPQQSKVDVILKVTEQGLASDVKGAIAGLEGARQDIAAVTGSINSRMNSLSTTNIFSEVHPGASVWGDYLYQNSNNQASINYHNALQGSNIGMDWTWLLDSRDTLTGGIAFGKTRDKLSSKDAGGSFKNTLNGDFYSVYGGWQQALNNNTWGFFANGVASYGDVSYALSSSNDGMTTSAIKEQLKSGYKGKSYITELRTGLNFHPVDTLVLQPYAVVGWSKSTAEKFANRYINVDTSENASWYAGGGARLTGNINAGNVRLMPWVDAGYVSEFSKNDSFTVNTQQLSQAKNRHYGLFGAGMSAGFTPNLTMNAGVFTGAGDISNGLSVQAGMKYNF